MHGVLVPEIFQLPFKYETFNNFVLTVHPIFLFPLHLDQNQHCQAMTTMPLSNQLLNKPQLKVPTLGSPLMLGHEISQILKDTFQRTSMKAMRWMAQTTWSVNLHSHYRPSVAPQISIPIGLQDFKIATLHGQYQ